MKTKDQDRKGKITRAEHPAEDFLVRGPIFFFWDLAWLDQDSFLKMYGSGSLVSESTAVKN